MTVAADGTFKPEITPWRGVFVKDADPLIVKDLEDSWIVISFRIYTHTYPFCWRCDTPLLYYARGIPGISEPVKLRIDWSRSTGITSIGFLKHVKEGRFGNWLENNIDWALGRERFWGTPLPVWQCSECNYPGMYWFRR